MAWLELIEEGRSHVFVVNVSVCLVDVIVAFYLNG